MHRRFGQGILHCLTDAPYFVFRHSGGAVKTKPTFDWLNGNPRFAQSRNLRQGMLTLRDDAWSKACAGLTTVEEIFRVTQEDT